ncbi:ester cyclase [Salinarimonas soli]|uniref:Ester cyclase n=1 Tax=Salinarimonas soli TaxID=1638099 RepID=A0A5B2VXY7_9HYPH|nr:ester cyclase [Salinarimonas soli]KAA2244241.1 ester cyclase [Salinarimonas soli]
MVDAASLVGTKKALLPALRAIAEARPDTVAERLAAIYHPDAEWRGSHPLNEMRGVEAIAERVWRPLLTSFPDLERRDVIFIGGDTNGATLVGAVGHYCGTFRRDWLTIPATGRPIYLRYGEFHRVDEGRIVQSTVLIDVLDVIRQAGFWPVAPSLGTEEQWPGPITADGVVLTEQDPAVSAASIAQTLAMHRSLGDYDDRSGRGRDGLLEMPQKIHWHPKMMWYGPAGIGTTRGLQGFVDYHQLPFRIAFPNRRGGNHYVRIGDGAYSATGGWPSVFAQHLGGGFLGVAPTGRDVTMRVMDFYLHHEGLIRENWVPLDILNLLLQMDVDVLARMQTFFRRGALP